MALVVPAILAENSKEYHDKFELVSPYCRKIQVDIMDGIFVPDKTIKYEEIPTYNSPVKLELHLMMKDPLSIFQYPKHPAVNTIIFHYEAVKNPTLVLQSIPERLIKGIAINPETPTSVLLPFVKDIDLVLIMSVHPGKDGQEFAPEVLTKIGEIKAMRPGIIIEMDGGINKTNAQEIAASNIDQAVVGSFLYQKGDIQRTIKELMLDFGDIEGVSL